MEKNTSVLLGLVICLPLALTGCLFFSGEDLPVRNKKTSNNGVAKTTQNTNMSNNGQTGVNNISTNTITIGHSNGNSTGTTGRSTSGSTGTVPPNTNVLAIDVLRLGSDFFLAQTFGDRIEIYQNGNQESNKIETLPFASNSISLAGYAKDVLIGLDNGALSCDGEFTNCSNYAPANNSPDFTGATQVLVSIDETAKAFLIRLGQTGIRWQYRTESALKGDKDFTGSSFTNLRMMSPESATAFREDDRNLYVFKTDGGRRKCSFPGNARYFKKISNTDQILFMQSQMYETKPCSTRGQTKRLGMSSVDRFDINQTGHNDDVVLATYFGNSMILEKRTDTETTSKRTAPLSVGSLDDFQVAADDSGYFLATLKNGIVETFSGNF